MGRKLFSMVIIHNSSHGSGLFAKANLNHPNKGNMAGQGLKEMAKMICGYRSPAVSSVVCERDPGRTDYDFSFLQQRRTIVAFSVNFKEEELETEKAQGRAMTTSPGSCIRSRVIAWAHRSS
ncbi:hypothetical protein FIE12Z_5052 [Fusarium flagelliforme]|uniref:Uncharacterized protein n=1 Tax=Fusarium flagelliforme TaxID=2675880 RepID=A0A395MRS0_9HYPO|nr:hypothetical protein FIE12Z_5052 [Fusarium flagelliforme]